MIKGIDSSTRDWINVQGSNSANSVYIDNNKLQQGIAGQVRHTGYQFEVNDGNSWKPLYENMVIVDVTGQANDVLAWAMKKMIDEREANQLATTNRAVAVALEEYRAILAIAEERLNLVVTLAKEHA
jgi:hypothetical protein